MSRAALACVAAAALALGACAAAPPTEVVAREGSAVTFAGAVDGIHVGSTSNEIAAVAYIPTLPADGRVPVALIQHGGHTPCATAEDPWPCASPEERTPSYLGYDWLGTRLADEGYLAVSVSANATIGSSADVDGEAKLLAWWLETLDSGTGPLPDLAGRLDTDRLVLIGHSRGGDAVAQLLTGRPGAEGIDAESVQAAVLLAPVLPVDDPTGVDLGTSATPTLTLYGTCDGDALDMPAVWATAFTGAGSRTEVMTGANHNYFNTQWTPGPGVVDAVDDAAQRDDAACRAESATRLTAAEQQEEAGRIISAFLADVDA
ncbi:hypothetical protein [Tessaracoccus palaemonis]|uniref:Alpha/beta hydrolase n=1 Tax=Tessaracoccus palaemonis TaxID=2829499 RepID=A0ABX8SIT8_9ACTN|nr:hypothetical protein [Tessaracoccus palaemonis]QXT62575.1 hypothetical protein KDB89_12660 [Tessaracoccus palaemonis]